MLPKAEAIKIIFAIDMDGVLVSSVEKSDYEKVKPIQKTIDIVNHLFRDGHIIKIFTSRGQTTGLDYEELTKKQLKEFGIEYHELIMGKPHFDLYVCDKSVFVSRFIKAYEDLIR